MTALGSFSAPYVFGGGFRVMTTQIVATKLNGELPLAMVETVALALVAALGLALLRRTEGDELLAALGKGAAPPRRPIRRAPIRALAATAGWLFTVLLLLPHLTLALVSLVPYSSWTTEALPPVLSFVNYQRLFGEPERLRPLVNSLWIAATSTLGAVALALAAGALARGQRAPRAPRGPRAPHAPSPPGRWPGRNEALTPRPLALPRTLFATARTTPSSVRPPRARPGGVARPW